MKILITGAAGHLGVNLVRKLIEQGEHPRIFVRERVDAEKLFGRELEQAIGDIRDPDAISRALEGCSHLYHLAAFVSIRSGDRQKLFDINVLGTRNLMHHARIKKLEKVVHCSSLGAVGVNPDGASTEDWTVSPYEETTDYEISKTFAETEVFKEIAKGLPATIVNPSGIVGPWDYRPSLIGKTILDFAHGKMNAYVDGAFDFVPMRDVVEGIIGAMEKGSVGERYLLTGEEVSIFQTLLWLEKYTGEKRPKIKIPGGAMQNIAIVKDWVERKFFPNATPRFNYHSIRLLKSGKYGDNSKAVKELGLQPTPVELAYKESVEWFKTFGYI